jgi:hypothetical protein
MVDTTHAAPAAVRSDQPARRVIATFDNYADAERAVNYLADQHFEVQRVVIVGRDPELVEQVTGRLNYGWAALRGGAAGALTGGLIGWVFGLLNWWYPLIAGLVLACYGAVFGVAVGALTGLVMYAFQAGRRDFTTVRSLQPKHFDVVADVDQADRAIQLLSSSANQRSRQWQQQ